jgi:hypothetical protein
LEQTWESLELRWEQQWAHQLVLLLGQQWAQQSAQLSVHL